MIVSTESSKDAARSVLAAPTRYATPVIESQSVGGTFHRLRLSCPPIADAAQPGQFVHVLPRLSGATEAYDPLLRRAFSIMSTSGHLPHAHKQDARDNWFEILFRVGGRGTSLLARCREGDILDVLGPLGNGFDLLDQETCNSGANHRHLLLVGGGIGVPPMIFAAQAVVSRETTNVEAFIGARNKHELVGVEALRRAGAVVHVATDDGSEGQRGLVTEPLRQRLQEVQDSRSQQPLNSLIDPALLVCACGPWPMLKAVAAVCALFGVECRVSLEENMPCGVGVCNGCVVPMLDAADDYGRFRRICVQGPVLDARLIDWGSQVVSPSIPVQINDNMSAVEHQGASQ